MADTTSVGRIQLDVEISQESLNAEMNRLGNAFNNSFKSMFSGMTSQTNNFVKESIGRIGNGFKNFTQAGTGSSEKVSKSVTGLNNQYDKTQEKIMGINAELNTLYTQMDAITARCTDLPAFSGMTKDESVEKMLGADTEYQKLSAEAAKLESKLEPLTAKNRELSEAIRQSGDAAQNTGNKLGNMGGSAKKAMGPIFKLTWLKKIFGNETKRASNATSGLSNALNRMSRTIVRNLVVYGLIIKGLRSMISYTWSALKTNNQFAQSLNIIRTNLLVAFQPIYEFVLPALNALMKGIATVTTYIASAISALFGKTYKQSFNSAKAMNKQIGAMNGLGKATKGAGKAAKKAGKEAEGMLMPFDEINQLNLDKGADADGPDIGGGGGGGGGAPGFEMVMPDMAQIDMSGIEKFKEIMGQIFEPFKKAWKNEGQATIDAMKNAFNSILDLSKSIGKSWLEVWTNGTGQKTVENILKILQNIFNIAENLATSFKKAWEQNEVGTRIIQGMFDIFNTILETIGKITKSTAEWAKTLDFSPLLESISKLLESLKPLTQNIGDGLAWLWENALLPIAGWTIEDVLPVFLDMLAEALKVLNNVIDALKPLGQWLWDNFLQPLAKWTGGVIVDVLKGIADGLKAIGDWIKDHQTAVENMAIIIGSFAAAWGLVNAAMAIWNVVGAIATGVTSAFGAAVAFLTSPIGLVTLAIAGIIAALKFFGVTMDDIKNAVKKFVDAIVGFFKWLWDVLVGHSIIPDMVNAIVKWFKDMVGWVTKPVKDLVKFVTQKFEDLKNKIGDIWDGIKSWTSEKWGSIKETISKTADNIWSGTKETFSNIGKKIGSTWDNAKSSTSSAWSSMKSSIQSHGGGIKGVIGTAMDSYKSIWRSGWDTMNRISGGKLGDILSSTKSKMASIKNAIANSKLGQAWSKIWNFKLPKIKLPHFSLDGKFNLMPPSVPKVGIKWYDKGGIFTGPQIIGVGEKRPEFVGALDDLREIVRDEIKNAVASGGFDSGGSDDAGDIIIKVGEDEFARIAIKAINRRQRGAGGSLLLV